jgi:hypothetical protein
MTLGDSAVTFERQTMTYKIRGVEEQLVVSMYERFLGDDQKPVQNFLGEGMVAYAPEFEDGEEHFVAVPLAREGHASGALSLRVQLVQEARPVTSGPAISQYLLNNLYKAPQDVVEKLLNFFEVDGEEKNHEEKVDALSQALDDIERRHGEKLTAIYEQEAAVDPDALPRSPGLGSRALTRVGQLLSSQGAPRFMLPHMGWFSSGDTKDILVKWVTCRQEIAVRAGDMGDFLNHEGNVLAGIGILGNMFDMTRWCFDIATVVTLLIPETGGNSAVYGMTSEALGVGSGTVGVLTYYIATNSANQKQRSLFQMLAQENSLHRKAYFALHGDASVGTADDVTTEDLPLDKLPSDATVDEHLQWSGNETMNLLANSQNTVTDTLTFVVAIQSIIGSAQTMKNGSGNGDQLKSLAKEYGYDGKPPAEVADLMLADPKKYVVAPPPGMVIFDLTDTSLNVRMVVREKSKTQYFDTQSPVPLPNKRCEVSFQVHIRTTWKDVNEWDPVAKAPKVPLKKQVYRLNGQKDFRWFHLEGPYPVRVVGVDDENGPMQ